MLFRLEIEPRIFEPRTQESHRRAEQIYGTANCTLEVRVSSISHASRTTTLIFKLGIDPLANLFVCAFFIIFSILKTWNAEF
jgi:hypothetical protein